MSSGLRLSVIILNWNGRAYLEACLDAVAAQIHSAQQVVLVDNGSSDGSVDFVRRRYPWVELRENGGNLGFAAGNNVALREVAASTETDVAFLLNPDVVLAPDCLGAIAETLVADERIGIAGTRLLYPGGETIQHAGGFITHPQAMPGHYGIGEPDTEAHGELRDVTYVIGAAAAVRMSMLDEIGLLDEGFFLYFEDADLCARALRAGYRVVYQPAASGIHIESAMAVKGSFAYLQRFHTGRWRYLLKHFPAEEIVGKTVAAEEAWLGHLDGSELRALSLAYLATRRRLYDILAARERDGAPALSSAERERVADGLGRLRQRAREAGFDAAALVRLSEAAVLRERPFRSDVPMLGPLIARFRAAWNNIASRWYVAHLMQQQNEFNELAVTQIERYENELREQMELLEEQIVTTGELENEIRQLKQRLRALRETHS